MSSDSQPAIINPAPGEENDPQLEPTEHNSMIRWISFLQRIAAYLCGYSTHRSDSPDIEEAGTTHHHRNNPDEASTSSSSWSLGRRPPHVQARGNQMMMMVGGDEKKVGKWLLGLAIQMGVTVVLSAVSTLVHTTIMNMIAVSVSVSASIALIFNGMFLRPTFPKSSTFMLLSGASLMMLSFFALVGFFLPVYLAWLPALCWFASLFPFAMSAWAYFRPPSITTLNHL